MISIIKLINNLRKKNFNLVETTVAPPVKNKKKKKQK